MQNSIICPGNCSSGESNNSLLELVGPCGLVEETKEINTLSAASPVPCEEGCAHAAFRAPEQEQNVSLTKLFSSSTLNFSECPQRIQRVKKKNKKPLQIQWDSASLELLEME